MHEARGTDRVLAVVGAGPAGFYLAEALLAATGDDVRVDVFEKLPAPHGLVRYGVAPDHEKIKSVTRVFERIASHPRLRLWANVGVGRDVSLDELRARHAQVALCTGCDRSRQLGISGEQAEGNHAAADFVAWYNGHPEFVDYAVDLSVSAAAIVGAGDVALDLARMLLLPPAVLSKTDCSEKALAEFSRSQVREVHVIARRGPAQASFADKELRAIAELQGVGLHLHAASLMARPAQSELPPAGRRKLELLRQLAARPVVAASRHLHLHFLRSPSAFVVRAGRVAGLRLAGNRLVRRGESWVAEPDGTTQELAAGLSFCSVGYRGTALEGAPFDEKKGLIPHRAGRVLDASGRALPGLYVAGWIKRGASGVIGTNKADARETAKSMLADLATGLPGRARSSSPMAGLGELLAERGVRVIDFERWQRLDALERARGEPLGRPRVKFETAGAAWAALGDLD